MNINSKQLVKLMEENSMGSGLLAQCVNESPDVIQRLLHGGGESFLIAKVEAVLRASITTPDTKEESEEQPFSIRMTFKLAESRTTQEVMGFVNQNIMNAQILLRIESDRVQPRKDLIKFLKERTNNGSTS